MNRRAEAIVQAGQVNRALDHIHTAKQELRKASEILNSVPDHVSHSMRLARSVDEVTIIAQEVDRS